MIYLDPSSANQVRNPIAGTCSYGDADGHFTLEALVWEAGQTTPAYSIPFWSVVGVYEGELRESCYRKLQRPDASIRFVPNGVTHHRSGDVTYIDPAGENLHRFDNPTGELTISVHVFGTDRRSSENITDCYLPDDLAVSGLIEGTQ